MTEPRKFRNHWHGHAATYGSDMAANRRQIGNSVNDELCGALSAQAEGFRAYSCGVGVI